MMTDQRDYTLGEVGRMVEDLKRDVAEQRVEARESRHRLANEINLLVAPVSALGVRMNVAERTLDDVTRKVDAVTLKAAAISGAIGVLGFFGQLLWPWKGH